MNDRATVSDDVAAMDLSVDGPGGDDLEQRVQRLEETVGSLKDTGALEERIVDKVTERLRTAASPTQFSAAPPAPDFREQAPARFFRGHYAWLFFDMMADARLMLVMLFDRRYAMAWTTHLVVWLFVPAILTSAWWFPPAYVPVLGTYLDKVLDLLLAFCVYKALSRETRRYRELTSR